MNSARVSALLLALTLQVAPLARVVQSVPVLASSPFAIIFQWLAGAAAVAGSFHALSAATTLVSDERVTGTVGEPFSYVALLTTDDFGDYQFYSASGIAPVPADITKLGINITRNGGEISGTPTRAGTFPIRIKGYERSNLSGHNGAATVTFVFSSPTVTPPTISKPPLTQTVIAGDPVTLSVEATGTGTLTYQWIKDSFELPGATASTLTINPVTEASEGSYTVRVSSGTSSQVSTPAQLTVLVRPKITLDPVNAVVDEGSTTVLTVAASGKPAPTYQWFFEKQLLGGQTGASLSLSPVTSQKAGNYYAVASNAAGSVTSLTARISLTFSTPFVSPQYTNRTFHVGELISLEAFAGQTVSVPPPAHGPPLRPFQWRKDGVPLAATNHPLVISHATPGDAGLYELIASDGTQSVTGRVASVTILPLQVQLEMQPGGSVRISTEGLTSRAYALEHLPALGASAWQVVSNVLLEPFQTNKPASLPHHPEESRKPVQVVVPKPAGPTGFWRWTVTHPVF